jgi:hypothetical protein
MASELVERLRTAAHWAVSENDHVEPELCNEAAARIEALEARERALVEMPPEMDHEMQMVWQAAWHEQSIVRHKARFKAEQPISCEAAAWAKVYALVRGRAQKVRIACADDGVQIQVRGIEEGTMK